MVSQSRRYWRHLDTLRRQLAQLGTDRDASTAASARRRTSAASGSRCPIPLLIDMAIHQFDLARVLIGSDPVAVYCESYNPSWSWFARRRRRRGASSSSPTAPGSASPAAGAPGSGDIVERQLAGQRGRRDAPSGTATTRRRRRTPTVEPIAAPAGDEPGADRRLAGGVRWRSCERATGHRRARCTATCSAWPWSRRRSRRPRERRRVSIAEILDRPTTEAVRTETDPDIRAVLASWPSVHDIDRRAGTLPLQTTQRRRGDRS